MADSQTTLSEMKTLMSEFVAERNWEQFHDAKNLSACIAIEAAELMEHFQWTHSDALGELKKDAAKMGEVTEEVADVFAYLLSFATIMNIDLSDALRDKMVKNARKYPADQYYGKFSL